MKAIKVQPQSTSLNLQVVKSQAPPVTQLQLRKRLVQVLAVIAQNLYWGLKPSEASYEDAKNKYVGNLPPTDLR